MHIHTYNHINIQVIIKFMHKAMVIKSSVTFNVEGKLYLVHVYNVAFIYKTMLNISKS